MDRSIDKLAANYLLRDVLASAVSPSTLAAGDTVVVVLNSMDKVGVVTRIAEDNTIFLRTTSGTEVIEPVDQESVYMIRKADHVMETLKLRNHTEYERDLKDMTKETHQYSGRPEYGPEVDTDTKIPRSKICLNLKKKVSE